MPLRRDLSVLAGACLLLLARPASAQTYYGPEVAALARQSVDVMKMHTYAMRAQLALDRAPMYLELTFRGTPARFRFDDGRTLKAGLSRLGFGAGLGVGQPRSGVAGFLGAQGDYAYVSEFPVLFSRPKEFRSGTQQLMLYGGFAVHGFQVSGGIVARTGFNGLNRQGFFTAGNGAGVRPGAPPDAIAGGASESREEQTSVAPFVSFTQAEGVTAGLSFARIKQEAATRLAALRTEVAPERLAKTLSNAFIPGLGFDHFAQGIDYYGDTFAQMRSIAERNAAGLPTVSADSIPVPATSLIPVGLYDIAQTGLSLRQVTQVSPNALFRQAGLSYVFRYEQMFRAAARADLFKRGDGFTGSFEAYGAFAPTDKFSAWVTVSYSYNTPDAATFLPIPNAHVLGIQWVFGPPEMARPLVPLMIRNDDKNKGGK